MKAKSILKKSSVSSLLSIFFAAFVSTILTYAVFTNDDAKMIDGEFAQKDRIVLSDYVEGEVLVKFRKGVDMQTVDSIADSLFFDVERYFRSVSMVKGQVYVHMKSESLTTQQMQTELTSRPEVEDVSPNYRLYADTTIPNDPRFSELWGLHNTGQTGGTTDVDIDAPEAWDKTTGSSNVIAAVIDTGIDYNHPDLAANIWVNPNEIKDGVDNDGNGYVDDIHGINAITGSGDPLDDNGHGTHCSGTIGAVGNNGMGVVGVNWNVKLMGTKFLNASGSGYSSNAITCIDYIIDQKNSYGQNIVAINASYGGGGYSQSVKDAIDAAGAAGIVFCASAGNSGTNNDSSPHYPSSYTSSNIIAVTAVDHSGYQYYSYGATSVDLGAPGRSILSTLQCVYTPQPGDIFFDDMGSGGSQWTHGGILDSWDITNAAAGGLENYWWDMSYGNFWSDSPGTGYVHNVDNWLAAANDIDLSSYAGQTLYLGFDGGFQMDYFVSNDTAAVEVSNDSGNNWVILADLKTLYQGHGYYYKKQVYVIPETYKTTHFRFRFHITSDDTDYSYYGYKNKGWIIDNIGIGTNVTCSYGSKNGTSMATPHVTGAVAFIAAYYPSETAAERIARILDNVVLLPSLGGKCVTGGLLNLDSALGIVTPTISVISPNGGEYWEIDSTQSITWSSTGGTIEDVKIEYSIDNGTSWTEIIASTTNNGSYDWTVPDNPSDNCLIRVSDTDEELSDVSDAVFSIVSPASITVTSPNGDEDWDVGSSRDITWTSSGPVDNVKIDYSIDNGASWIEIVASTGNDGSYNWTVPDTPSNNCLVRISDTDGYPSDVSDAVFSIDVRSLTLTSPNGGQTWGVGDSHPITWTSTGGVGNVKLEYTVNNGSRWIEIVSSTTNDGSYDWLIPDNPSENCRVRVSEIDGPLSDQGDNVFIITIFPTITVTSPNGGENLETGSLHTVTWTSTGTVGDVKIEYSTPDRPWMEIVAVTPNDGKYKWTVPETASENCTIRVSELDGEPSDVSDAVFTIFFPPSFTVTSPNGGEYWEIGSQQSITWTSRETTGYIRIKYSTDNGSSWKYITTTADDGEYNWTVPDAPSGNCLIRVSETDGDPSDVSDAVFTIYQGAAITVTSPNGGENWQAGSSHNITWTSTGTVGNVKIQYSTNNGSSWTDVAASTANDGSYNWTVPEVPSTNCLVRISEVDGEPVDVSNAVFSICSQPTITVTSPNGGEVLEVDSSHHITWTTTETVGDVKIECSTNNGSVWRTIAASTANDGSYNWTVPDTPSANCLVRVSEADGTPADVNDAVFAIVLPPSLTVTSPNGGENWQVGTAHNITWDSTGPVGNVKIEYSTDNGES
jgi:subtilisin family serine protease